VIYLVAATLWIFVVLVALGIGCRVMVKVRARRRRMNRLIEVVRVPLQIGGRGLSLVRLCRAAVRPATR
jgi:hypothetical protein